MGQIVCPCVYVLMILTNIWISAVPTFSYGQPQSNVYFENFVSKAGKFSIDYPGYGLLRKKIGLMNQTLTDLSIYKEGEGFRTWNNYLRFI